MPPGRSHPTVHGVSRAETQRTSASCLFVRQFSALPGSTRWWVPMMGILKIKRGLLTSEHRHHFGDPCSCSKAVIMFSRHAPWDGRTLEWSIASPPPVYNSSNPRSPSRSILAVETYARTLAAGGEEGQGIHLPQPSVFVLVACGSSRCLWVLFSTLLTWAAWGSLCQHYAGPSRVGGKHTFLGERRIASSGRNPPRGACRPDYTRKLMMWAVGRIACFRGPDAIIFSITAKVSRVPALDVRS